MTFKFVIQPDTQCLIQNWHTDTATIANYIRSVNPAAFIQVGDMVEWPRTQDWGWYSDFYNSLGDMLKSQAYGNHDETKWPTEMGAILSGGGSRDITLYQKTFPLSRFQNVVDTYQPGLTGNMAQTLTVDGLDFVIVALGYWPNASMLNWLDSILTKYANKKVIINTHDYIDLNADRTAAGSLIWTVIKKHPNVVMTFNGHTYPGANHRADKADDGHNIYQFMLDYQDYDTSQSGRESNSYLQVFTFDTDKKSISVKTYSPVFNKYKTGLTTDFTISNVDFLSGAVSTPTPPGGNVAIPLWPGVTLGGSDALILQILAKYPNASQLRVSSGTDGDHGSSSFHYDGARQLYDNGSPANAVDVVTNDAGQSLNDATMRDFAQWVYNTFPDKVTELIHTTPFNDDNGFYIKFGVKQAYSSDGHAGVYDAATVAAHLNHVHLAMSVTNATAVLAQLGASAPPPPVVVPQPPTTDHVYIVDASDFNQVDPVRLAADGIQVFTHKLVEYADNGTFEHVQFTARMKAAVAAGMIPGAYVVPRTTTSMTIEDQADKALALLKMRYPELLSHPDFFWQVDLETWPYDNTAPDLGVRMANRFEQITPNASILYASKGQYGNSIPPGPPLWNANYDQSGESRPYRQMYAGDSGLGWTSYSGRSPLIWQYASDAVVGGQSPLDINVFRGTLDDFKRQVTRRRSPGGVTPTPTPAPEPSMDETERKAGNADYYGWQAVTELRDQVTGIRSAQGELPPIDNQLKKKLDSLEAKLDAIIAKLGA